MALFGKNKTGAKKHSIIEVIKYDGENDVLIWRFPNEDFNTNTQLIVGPAQEAIFVKGGQILGSFISGTYTLNTKNYPFIRALVGLATGGISPFSCTVYYANKAASMGIKWGTDTPISIIDPVYNVPADIRSYGDLSLRVENGQMLLEKLVGQAQGYSQQEISQFFNELIVTQVREVISSAMQERQLSSFGIDAHLTDMSAAAAEKIRLIFEPYGIAVNHFTISAITAPELDSIKQKERDLQEHRMETDVTAEDKQKMADAQAYENRALNISEQEKWVAEMGKKLAENPGPMMGGAGGAGFPAMFGGNTVRPSAEGTAEIGKMLLKRDEQPSRNMGDDMPCGEMLGMKEEPEVQLVSPPVKESFEERARRAKYLLDNGMISKEKYDAKMDQLMNEI